MDRDEACGFPCRRTGSLRQGNCTESPGESACSAATSGTGSQETIMNRDTQFRALIGLGVCVLIGGCTVGPKYQRATTPVPAKWDVSEPRRESAPKDRVAKASAEPPFTMTTFTIWKH